MSYIKYKDIYNSAMCIQTCTEKMIMMCIFSNCAEFEHHWVSCDFIILSTENKKQQVAKNKTQRKRALTKLGPNSLI